MGGLRWMLVAVVAFTALTPGIAAEARSVFGRIVAHESGFPVPGVELSVSGSSIRHATSDRDGNYRFDGLDDSLWVLRAQHDADHREGISSLDAALAMREAMGHAELDATERVVCDVDASGALSHEDGLEILGFSALRALRFAAAESCGSDWLLLPRVVTPGSAEVIEMELAGGQCQLPRVLVLAGVDSVEIEFTAAAFGDCSSSWPGAPSPTETPTASSTPTETPTPTPSATPSPSDTPSATPSLTPTMTPTSSHTASATPSFSPSATPSTTATHSPTSTQTRTPTLTPSATPTLSPTCVLPDALPLETPIEVAREEGGRLWLARVVPTASGWGLFWLRQPAEGSTANLYYAHLALDGSITRAPGIIYSLSVIRSRERYYLAAWHSDHFGILTTEGERVYYQNLSLDGTLSGRRQVGPPLLISASYDQESDGALISYPDGFLGTIEGECGGGHSCSYAFRLAPDGEPTSSVYTIVDFDFTHEFYPRAAWDGAGFAILSVKDINVAQGGIGTKYMRTFGSPGRRLKVVPSKEYFWDEFPEVAHNGDHFGALWVENSARSHAEPWRVGFATFTRDWSTGTLLHDEYVDHFDLRPGRRWSTGLHALREGWLIQYGRYVAGEEPEAVFRYRDPLRAANVERVMPRRLSFDALGSAVHPLDGRIAILQGSRDGSDDIIELYFASLPPCP